MDETGTYKRFKKSISKAKKKAQKTGDSHGLKKFIEMEEVADNLQRMRKEYPIRTLYGLPSSEIKED